MIARQLLPAIQVDAAINSGSSGGPALKYGAVVGVAFMSASDLENVGYIIPLAVVQRFLQDFERGKGMPSGIPDLGIEGQLLENPTMREYFKVKETGVLVTKVHPFMNVSHQVFPGDVLISLDDHEIGEDGTVSLAGSVDRVFFNYVVVMKYPGGTIKVGVSRNGTKMELNVTLETYPELVPLHLFDKPVTYVSTGTIVSVY